ncbi:hypothetical protein RN001_015671 [Aquatica leii]|uniref:Uncharacterized protein n=1 Tax=Aquatica leii TaxID=1421715 RepID=A0AAN7SAS2_9COLE|nr:hypothetical protein RN001_015671 [Aquatica leii]
MNRLGAPGNYIEEELIKFKRVFDGKDSVPALLFPCGLNEVFMKAIKIIAAKHDLASMYVEDGNKKSIAVFYPQRLGIDCAQTNKTFNLDLFDIKTSKIDKEVPVKDVECGLYEDTNEPVENSFDAKNHFQSTPICEKSSNSNYSDARTKQEDGADCLTDCPSEENLDVGDQALIDRFNNLRSVYNFELLSTSETVIDTLNETLVGYSPDNENGDRKIKDKSDGDNDQHAGDLESTPFYDSDYSNDTDDCTITYKNDKNTSVQQEDDDSTYEANPDKDQNDDNSSVVLTDPLDNLLTEQNCSADFSETNIKDKHEKNNTNEDVSNWEYMTFPEHSFSDSDYLPSTDCKITYKNHKNVWAEQEDGEDFWADNACESNPDDELEEDNVLLAFINRYNNLRSEHNFSPLSTYSKTAEETQNDDPCDSENKSGENIKENASDEEVDEPKENDEDCTDDEKNRQPPETDTITENDETQIKTANVESGTNNSESQNDEPNLSEKYTSKQYFNSKRRYWSRNARKSKRQVKKSPNATNEEKTDDVNADSTTHQSDCDDDNDNPVSENLLSKNDDIVAESVQQKTYQFDATPHVHIKIFVNERNAIYNSKQTIQNNSEDQIWKTAKAVHKTISEMSSCRTPDLDIIHNFVKDLYSDDRKFRKGNILNTDNETNLEEQKLNTSTHPSPNDQKEEPEKNQVTEEKSTEIDYKEEDTVESVNNKITFPTQRKNSVKPKVKKYRKNKNRGYKENEKSTPAQEEIKIDSVQFSPKIPTIFEEGNDEDKTVNEVPSPIRIKLCTDAVNVKGILNDLHRIRQQKDIKAMKEDEDIINIFKQINAEDTSVSKNAQSQDILSNSSEELKNISPQIETNNLTGTEFLEDSYEYPELNIPYDQLENELLNLDDSGGQVDTVSAKSDDANNNFFEEIKKRLGDDTCVVVASEEYNHSMSYMPFAIEIYNIPPELSTENILDLYQKVSPTVDWLDSDCAILFLKSEEEVRKALEISHDSIKSRPISAASHNAILAAIGLEIYEDAKAMQE